MEVAAEPTAEASAFRAKLVRRNRIEYAAGAFAVVGGGAAAWFGRPLAAVSMAAGMAVALGTLLLHLRRHPVPDDWTGLAARRRTEARLLRRVLIWYIAPISAGCLGYGLLLFPDPPLATIRFSAMAFAPIGAFALWLNRRAAAKLEAEAASIEASNGP